MIAVDWTAPARADLDAIDDWLTAIDPLLAKTTVDRIEAAGVFLGDRPRAGPVGASHDVHKWIVGETRYLLFYADDRNEILRIRHEREDRDA